MRLTGLTSVLSTTLRISPTVNLILACRQSSGLPNTIDDVI